MTEAKVGEPCNNTFKQVHVFFHGTPHTHICQPTTDEVAILLSIQYIKQLFQLTNFFIVDK